MTIEQIKQLEEMEARLGKGDWTTFEKHSAVFVKCGDSTFQRFMAEYNDPEDFLNGEFIVTIRNSAKELILLAQEALASRAVIEFYSHNYGSLLVNDGTRARTHLNRFKKENT